MPQIFEATTLGGIEVRNRLVRSATWDGRADAQGRVTGRMIDLYREVAEGGVGVVISGYAFVRPDGRQWPTQLGAHDDEAIPGLAELARAVHGGGGRLVGQIVHCGGQAYREATFGRGAVAPSAVASPGYPETPRELSVEEIDEIAGRFAAAASRMRRAGFDGVQLHGAHGYLISEFLTPSRNARTDAYGGSLENRSRFALDVYRAVRCEVGHAFPVWIKINGEDFVDGGATLEDAAGLVAALAAEGIDAVEVSGGTGGSGKLGSARTEIVAPADEAYFLSHARFLRRCAGNAAVITVGGIRSPEVIEAILAEGTADACALCRPLIREPDLPARWRGGDRKPAACISCRGCFTPAMKGSGVRCVRKDGEGDA
jgi:2,4-dienoyl-CoA reductase-like NADH-dependent reductase (Old Yellow Enzyme family)